MKADDARTRVPFILPPSSLPPRGGGTMNIRISKRAMVLLVCLALVVVAAYSGAGSKVVSGLAYAVETGKAQAAGEQLLNRRPGDLEHAFELAAQAVGPSVVSITSTQTVGSRTGP